MSHLRASIGTLSLLGLHKARVDVHPTTLYFLLGDRCYGQCSYCTQQFSGNNFLSRVRWPAISLEKILKKLPACHAFRVCIQTLKYPNLLKDLYPLIEQIRVYNIPLSLCVNPLPFRSFEKLKKTGIDRVGIGLDCAHRNLFQSLKTGVGSWETYLRSLENAQHIFGEATAHLIIGLGETDFALLSLTQKLHNIGISTALFAYTPHNRQSVSPPLERYRALQLASFLIKKDEMTIKDMDFSNNRLSYFKIPDDFDSSAFETSGCPHCNRPFYNESARGPLYNYPRKLTFNEYTVAENEVEKYLMH